MHMPFVFICVSLGCFLTKAFFKKFHILAAIRETKEALENVSVSVEVLQEGTERLHANLTDVKMHLSNTLSDSACNAAQAASTCNIIRNSLSQLNINANFSGVRYFNNIFQTLRVWLPWISPLVFLQLSGLVYAVTCEISDLPFFCFWVIPVTVFIFSVEKDKMCVKQLC